MISHHNYILSETHIMFLITRSIIKCKQSSNIQANAAHIITFESQYLWNPILQN